MYIETTVLCNAFGKNKCPEFHVIFDPGWQAARDDMG